jgi:hypothetical protein
MFTYSRLNKQKETKCREEGIDSTQAELFRDMGDASPLFRCVIINISVIKRLILLQIYDLVGLGAILEGAVSLVNIQCFLARVTRCKLL